MKKRDFTEKEINEISRQLSHPNGKKGVEIAWHMNKNNYGMSLKTIQGLKLKNHQRILEIRHGIAGHLKEIFSTANFIHYKGLERSALMHQEAIQLNRAYINRSQAQFLLYDGEKMPFSEQEFDAIFTVNTIYFWENPRHFLSQLTSFLKPKGLLSICFVYREFMEKLAFVNQNFSLYSRKEIINLIQSAQLKNFTTEIKEYEEEVESKTGELMNRPYAIVNLIRKT
jgi:SAM-dependent methyltransferase